MHRPLGLHRPLGAAQRQTRGQEGQERIHGQQGQEGRDMFWAGTEIGQLDAFENEERGKREKENEIECWIVGTI